MRKPNGVEGAVEEMLGEIGLKRGTAIGLESVGIRPNAEGLNDEL